MIKRLKTGTGLVAGLAALALGGSAIAGAATNTPTKTAPAAESTTGPDIGNVQSGDQTTPDVKGQAKAAESSTSEATSESASETNGESASSSDGPGGYADPAGNANADTQQQGEH
jgi:hypothetical protein